MFKTHVGKDMGWMNNKPLPTWAWIILISLYVFTQFIAPTIILLMLMS